MKPSVGRIVHFYKNSNHQPLPAIVQKVQSDDTVALVIFDDFGTTLHRSMVRESQTPEVDCWMWPPKV